jgi:RecA-family ATPase
VSDIGTFEPSEPIDGPPSWHYDAFDSIAARPTPFCTITPADWKGTEAPKAQWLAAGRIPANDLTLLTGNGGSGKTEIAVQLPLAVAAGLGDWLGCTIESGPALFLSCEEPEEQIRERVERICKHRKIDPYAIHDFHLHCPDLEETWLGSADKAGHVKKTPLLLALESWIRQHRPRVVAIDSVAAVFDGEAFARRQVRAFLATLRKIARDHSTAILLLDHPSVRGMNDGTGTANSVDWRNSVRSMLSLSEPDKNDFDLRTLEVKKANWGRSGEKVTLRWNGLTFTVATSGEVSTYRAQADRDVEELFLRLLDKRNAQGRRVHANTAKGSAPSEFEQDPDANGIKAEAFRLAMERLLAANRTVLVETGPASRRRTHLERVSSCNALPTLPTPYQRPCQRVFQRLPTHIPTSVSQLPHTP